MAKEKKTNGTGSGLNFEAQLWAAADKMRGHMDVYRPFMIMVIRSPFAQGPIWEAAEGMAIRHLSITDFGKMIPPLPPPRRTTPDRGQSGATDGLGGCIGNAARCFPRYRCEPSLRPRRRTHRHAQRQQSIRPVRFNHWSPWQTTQIAMTLTYFDFLQTVTENEGEVLSTSGGRATFRLGKSTRGVQFTPISSGMNRDLNQEAIERYLEVFNQSQSTNTTDYTDAMRNASYVLAIIKLWIGQQPQAPLVNDGTSESGNIDPEFSAPEGDLKVRSHRQRERSRELVTMAKLVFKKQNQGRLFCEVCGFNFGEAYEAPDFIEVHHRIPLRDLKPGAKTKLSDLAMVCANCHRMLHRGHPWPTVEGLKYKINAAKNK
jgi:predicted HNH restriction endonuclease